MFRLNVSLRRVILSTLTLSLVGCSSPGPEIPKESTPIDPATAGKITATVTFDGTVPPAKEINMQTSAQCAKAHDGPVFDDSLLVANGRVKNAVVWIKSGLESYKFAPPAEPVHIDQAGCLYAPRVAGALVGQTVIFLNSDPEPHNVHGKPTIVSSWNFILSRKGATKEVTFTQPEVGIPVICDIHGWMRAYVSVFSNPFFKVTPTTGEISLDGVPPGDYVLGVWHEKLGTFEQKVSLTPSGSANVTLAFPASH